MSICSYSEQRVGVALGNISSGLVVVCILILSGAVWRGKLVLELVSCAVGLKRQAV